MIFYCKYCPHTVDDDPIQLYNHYSLKHCHIRDGYLCAYPRCQQRFKTRSDFSVHIFKCHTSNPDNIYQCLKCRDRFQSRAALLGHIRDHIRGHETMKCPFCDFESNILGTWKSHQTRSHSANSTIKQDYMVQLATAINSDNSPLLAPKPIVDNPIVNDVTIDSSATSSVQPGAIVDDDIQNDLLHMLATLFLKMQAMHNIPVSVIDSIIECLNSYNVIQQSLFYSNIETILKNAGLSDQTLETVLPQIDTALESVFYKSTSEGGSLSTGYRRQSYCEKNMTYIKPVEYVLEKSGRNVKSFQYIPIIDVLSEMLSKDDLLNQVIKPHVPNTKGQYFDYRDGKYYQDILEELGGDVQIRILIALYNDDAEVVNPLGTSTGTHKICAVYWSLQNVPAYFRSKIAHIKLAVLAKRVDVDKHGLAAILKPLIADLKVLETRGVFVDSLESYLKCAIIFVAADNLGAHFIGNHFQSFSRLIKRFCRYCLITHDQLREEPCNHPDSYLWRDQVTHAHHVQQVAISDANKQLYGIKGDCILSEELDTFHVSRGLPPDPPHDILEGILPIEIAIVFDHFIKAKILSLGEINHLMMSFKYIHHDRTNKPHAIGHTFSKKMCISGNAHENWNLIRLLPLILGDKVPFDDPYWVMLLLLRDITEIAMAPCLDEYILVYMEELIQEHAELFCEYAGVDMRPKHHFLSHYPRLVRCFGPLLHTWTLRYEAKHKFFKKIAKMVMNFINILKTMAVRHQLFEALLFQSDNFRGDHDVEIGNEYQSSTHLLSKEVKEVLEIVSENDFITETNRVEINGMDYSPGLAVHVGHENRMVPLFARIEKIIVHSGIVYFLVRDMDSWYNEKLHIYELTFAEPAEFFLVTPQELEDYYPLALYPFEDHFAVCLKHFLMNKQ